MFNMQRVIPALEAFASLRTNNLRQQALQRRIRNSKVSHIANSIKVDQALLSDREQLLLSDAQLASLEAAINTHISERTDAQVALINQHGTRISTTSANRLTKALAARNTTTREAQLRSLLNAQNQTTQQIAAQRRDLIGRDAMGAAQAARVEERAIARDEHRERAAEERAGGPG